MSSLLSCPGCSGYLKLPDGYTGSAVRCPKCRTVIPLLAVSAEPVPLELDDEPAPPPPPRKTPAARPSRKPATSAEPFDFDADRPGRGRPGRRPQPEDDTPKWLLGVAAVPLVLIFFGGAIGGLFGGLTAGLNTALARRRGLSVGLKLGAMAGITTLGVVAYFVAAAAFLTAVNGRDAEQAGRDTDPPVKRAEPPPAKPLDPVEIPPRTGRPRPPAETPPPRDPVEAGPGPVRINPKAPPAGWDVPVTDYPASAAIPPGTPPKGARADSIYGLANDHLARLPDGPAAVTAAHQDGDTLAVGYADGSTALWDLRKPVTDPPAPGPKFPGPVERVWNAGHGRYVVAETAGRLRVVTARPPHKGVLVPEGEFGMRLCAFGTAGIVRRTPDGYEARWLVHAVFDPEVVMPPQDFGKPFSGYERPLAAPPVEPQFLTWLHTTPAAVLPDGRITVWNGQGKALTVEAHPKPVRAWSVSTNQVALTTLDEAGNLHIRRNPDFTLDLEHRADGLSLTRVVSDPGGTWTLGADEAGGVTAWEHRDGTSRVIYRGVKGTRAEPVVPLTVAGFGAFVVGRGRAVELWTPHRLRQEPGGKK